MISMLMMRCSFCLPEFVLPMIKSCLLAPMLPSWRKDKYDEDADDDDDDEGDDDDDDDNGDGGGGCHNDDVAYCGDFKGLSALP